MRLENTLSKKIFTSKIEKAATRNGYGEGLVEAGKENKDVVALCADVTESTKTHFFRDKYPHRFFTVGVAEQNMAGIAAGMALTGKVPIAGNLQGVFQLGLAVPLSGDVYFDYVPLQFSVGIQLNTGSLRTRVY